MLFSNPPEENKTKKQKLIPPGEFNDFFMIITTTPYTPKPTKKKHARTHERRTSEKKVDFDLSAIFCRPFFTRIIKSPIWEKLVEKSSNLKWRRKKYDADAINIILPTLFLCV